MKVTFSCEKHMAGVIPAPVKSLRMAPEYFRKVKPQVDNNPYNGTVKRCVPFLDALSAGFIISLWADMYVFAKDGEIRIDFPPDFPQPHTLGDHPSAQIPNHPLSRKRYGNIQLKFVNPWVVKTEPGVSCLFTAPLNHLETRFKILDGIVDTDTYYNNVNFPFIWTGGDGEFFFCKGTPLVQVIPFRREEHELEVSVIDSDHLDQVKGILGTKLKNGYRDEFWSGAKKKSETPIVSLKETPDADAVASVSVDPAEPLILENPVVEAEPDGRPGLHHKTQESSDAVEVEDLTSASGLKEGSSSGIVEIVVDNESKGFGEGSF